MSSSRGDRHVERGLDENEPGDELGVGRGEVHGDGAAEAVREHLPWPNTLGAQQGGDRLGHLRQRVAEVVGCVAAPVPGEVGDQSRPSAQRREGCPARRPVTAETVQMHHLLPAPR